MNKYGFLAVGAFLLLAQNAFADTKISQMANGGSLTVGDIIPILRSGGNFQVTYSGGSSSGVSTFTGDNVIYNNSAATGAVTLSLANQSPNIVFAGPASGSATTPAFRALVGADLPLPSASTLGGIQSIASLSHNFISSISTSGVPVQTQPQFSDLSGNIAVSQMNSGTSASSSTFWRGDGTWAAVTTSGGGGTPASPTGSLQYNNASSFGGATGLYYSTSRLGLDLAQTTTGNGISFAASGTDTTSLAVGPSSLLSQTSTGSHNTGVGTLTMSAVTTGVDNTAIGYNAGQSITVGTQNVEIGSGATGITTGIGNTVVGYLAGTTVGAAAGDTFIGSGAGTNYASPGLYNTIIGLQNISHASNSSTFVTAIGVNALGAYVGPGAGGNAEVVAVGANACSSLTTGIIDDCIGAGTGSVLTTGSAVTLIGGSDGVSTRTDVALANTSTAVAIGHGAHVGSLDVAIGNNALFATATNGLGNVGVGYKALTAVTTGLNNTAIGYQAGNLITVGGSNLVLGALAGTTSLSTGSDNILIGGLSATTTPGASHELHIHDPSLAAGTDAVTITGMGTNTTEAATIHGVVLVPDITTDATKTDATICEDTTTHQLYFGSGTLGVCLGTSSIRYKRDVVAFPDDALSRISNLKPVSYFYKKGHGDNGAKLQYGFLAEDMVDVFPKLVDLDKQGRPNTVDLVGLIPVLVKSIQEQQKEIDELKAR